MMPGCCKGRLTDLKPAVEVKVEIVDLKVPDHWHNLLHCLWSKAVGGPDYVKAEWIELENILFQAAAKALQKEEPRVESANRFCGA